jgi:hypothetical protein
MYQHCDRTSFTLLDVKIEPRELRQPGELLDDLAGQFVAGERQRAQLS